LLGRNIFEFIKDENAREKLFAITQKDGRTRLVSESSVHLIHGSHGSLTQVEIVVAASESEQQPLFTAILRERPSL
jgi:hypothetical protein